MDGQEFEVVEDPDFDGALHGFGVAVDDHLVGSDVSMKKLRGREAEHGGRGVE